jgi:hypothetical protein
VLAALMVSSAFAASIFSVNGIGEPLAGGGARIQGLGGGGLGLADSMGFNLDNPALGAYVTRTQVRLGGQIGLWQTQANGKSDADDDYQWQNVYLFFPVSRTWRIGLGAEPKSSMNLFTISSQPAVFHDPGGRDTSVVQYEARNTWKGGGADLRIDNSFRLGSKGAVGLSLSYLVLRNDQIHSLDLPPYAWDSLQTIPYNDAAYTAYESFRGWSAAIGGYYAFSPKLTVGVVFRPRFSGTWSYEARKTSSDLSITSSRSGFRPGEINVGLMYQLSKALLTTLDIQTGQWEKGDLGIMADPDKTIKPENPLWISVGVERPMPKPQMQTGLTTLGYRGGLYYRKHYWPKRNDTAVTDIGASLGTSIPLAGYTGLLHVALDGGVRGLDEKKLGAKEMFFRTALQLEINETWFHRTKPRAPK